MSEIEFSQKLGLFNDSNSVFPKLDVFNGWNWVCSMTEIEFAQKLGFFNDWNWVFSKIRFVQCLKLGLLNDQN